MKHHLLPALALCVATGVFASDLTADITSATQTVMAHMKQMSDSATEGRPAEAKALLFSLFPEKTRTAAQEFVIANALFSSDPKTSYALHQKTARSHPDNPNVIYEWALEQHRAGDYAGAFASYDIVIRANPDFAPIYGLSAECLIRTGKTDEAVARWKQSETAASGTLETFESLVCDIRKDTTWFRERAVLLERVRAGDTAAAVRLIALHVAYESDWWNHRPNLAAIAHDIPVLEAMPDSPGKPAIVCMVKCIAVRDREKTERILNEAKLLLDKDRTLPANPVVAALLADDALAAGILTRDELSSYFGDRLLANARKSGAFEAWQITANLHVGKPDSAAIEKEAWEATGNEVFAAGYLRCLWEKKRLRRDDPLLARARQSFPENAFIAGIALHIEDRAPTEAGLVAAIKAEFRRFSPDALSGRPSARTLRSYFAYLSRVRAAKTMPKPEGK